MTESMSRKTVEELDSSREIEDMNKIEAALFVSARFLSVKEIISLTDLNPIIIRELIEKIKEKYDKNDSAIEVVKRNEMWKMDVKQDYSFIANRLATGSSEFTKAEQETLALIAYKQPIKQSVIIKIRGNKAYEHIAKFKELGLIKTKRMGHTAELSLSDDFYDYFSSIDKGDVIAPIGEEVKDEPLEKVPKTEEVKGE